MERHVLLVPTVHPQEVVRVIEANVLHAQVENGL